MDAWSVATDAVGNVFGAGNAIAAGSIVSFGGITVPPSVGLGIQSMWVKYNSSGAVLWAGGTVRGDTRIINITTDPAGDLIVLGAFQSDTVQVCFKLANLFPDRCGNIILPR